MNVQHDEKRLEQLYWLFNSQRQSGGEKLLFKGFMRVYAEAQVAQVNQQMRDTITKANAQTEHFEREWYLRGDEIEDLKAANQQMLEALIKIAFESAKNLGSARIIARDAVAAAEAQSVTAADPLKPGAAGEPQVCDHCKGAGGWESSSSSSNYSWKECPACKAASAQAPGKPEQTIPNPTDWLEDLTPFSSDPAPQANNPEMGDKDQVEEPLFWYRPRSDGGFEGPIHNSQLEQTRKSSGAWVALYPKFHPVKAGNLPRLTDEKNLAAIIEGSEKPYKNVQCLSHEEGPNEVTNPSVTGRDIADAIIEAMEANSTSNQPKETAIRKLVWVVEATLSEFEGFGEVNEKQLRAALLELRAADKAKGE